MGKVLGSWSGMRKWLENEMTAESLKGRIRNNCAALAKYRNQNIRDSLNSDNPLERMFAVLDRRIGKRTVVALKDRVEQQPDRLKPFYRLRIEAEVLL